MAEPPPTFAPVAVAENFRTPWEKLGVISNPKFRANRAKGY